MKIYILSRDCAKQVRQKTSKAGGVGGGGGGGGWGSEYNIGVPVSISFLSLYIGGPLDRAVYYGKMYRDRVCT